jgi:hypothetical protein
MHGGAVRWTGAGTPPFPCTNDSIAALLRHVGGAKRVDLDPAIAAQLTPWGGVTYVEWLLQQILVCLPSEERIILAGLLDELDQGTIGEQLHRDRNWVRRRIQKHLIPRLVALITKAVELPQYNCTLMFSAQGTPPGVRKG